MASRERARYGPGVNTMRDATTFGLLPARTAAPVEWRVSDARVPYDRALAEMDARVAAISAGVAARSSRIRSSARSKATSQAGGALFERLVELAMDAAMPPRPSRPCATSRSRGVCAW